MSAVESPDHYIQGYIEVIYLIAQTLGPKGFKDFCMGNYLKYRTRHEHKGGEEDLKKAEQYLDWAVNGLPAPINNRVPRDKPEGETPRSSHVGSISALLEHELDALSPGEFRVIGVTMTPWINGYCSVGADVANVRHNTGYSLHISRVSAAVRYADIVSDLIAQVREQHLAKAKV